MKPTSTSSTNSNVINMPGTTGVGPNSGGGLVDSTASAAMNNTNFESYYHNICATLQSKGEVHSVSKVFAQLPSDEDRVKFVLEHRLFTSAMTFQWWKDYNFVQKDRSDSQKLRNLGNQVYQKNKLYEALDYYNQSICLAPHPPPPNAFLMHTVEPHDEGFTHEELSLGYANRSAVLFQLKEYELCIRDITRAFDNSYPNNLMYKLFERKARCLKAQKEYPRALEAMKSAEMWMKYSTLSETKSSNFKKDITKQVESLQEKVSAMAISDFSLKNDHRRAMSAPCKALATPVVKGGVNKEVPCIRDDVRIEYSEDKGRYLVATQDIPPGELLVTEIPYSSILLPEYYNSHCQSCFHRILAPIPCWCCARVRFCSDDCRVEAWERFHKVECQQLDLILDPTVGKMGMLAMRILTSSGKIYLEYVITKVREEMEARQDTQESPRHIGFNEEGVYDAADYRTVYTLVTNSKLRGVGDLFKRALMACYLLKILEMTPFFYNGGSDPHNVKLVDKVAMGAVLLRHLQNLPCNAHEVTELELGPTSSSSVTGSMSSTPRDSTIHEIGAAAFSTLSLINHSCDPNVVRHYYSSNAVVRTIRTIKKGEEILDNYGYHYAVMSREERQRKLNNQYFFKCDCYACSKNWPLYSSLPTSVVPIATSTVEQKVVMNEFTKMTKQYRKAFDSVLSGHYEDAVPILREYLSYLDNNVKRPIRDYNDCQEALKQCWSAIANAFSKDKTNKEIEKSRKESSSIMKETSAA